MVFLNEVLQIGIGGNLSIHHAVEHRFTGQASVACLHNLANTIVGRIFLDALTLQSFNNHGFQLGIRFELLTFEHLDDVESHGSLDRARHFAVLKGIGSILKFLQGHVRSYPGQFAALGTRAPIVRKLLGHFSKIGTMFKDIVDRIYAV